MSRFAMQRRLQLRAVAAETKRLLPDILSELPSINTSTSSCHDITTLAPLDPANCPNITLTGGDSEAGKKGTRIRVYDQDTFDAALDLQPDTTVASTSPPSPDSPSTNEGVNEQPKASKKPVAVLNLASEKHPGGGWENGALAQEEALCFRSSLYLSLHNSYYPIPTLASIYSPTVVLIRDAMSRGHDLLWPSTAASSLPVTSVITMAALRRPPITREGKYARSADRDVMKSKVRVILRLAAHQGHRKLVLGALGCGAFHNPPEEVASCFKDVFAEDEFQGGWWEDVVFAVLDNARGERGGKDGVGNFGVFFRALDGLVV